MNQSWTWSSERTIPSDTAAGREVVEELLAELQRQAWDEHEVFGVHLAVEEALVNAIKHGNRLDQSKTVRIRCQMSAKLLRVEISDEGPGFDPASVPDPTDDDNLECPSGRGLMLMRSFMTDVQFNAKGNCVIMEKQRGNGQQDG